MSYRSIKRVLGETSLERKCRFLFGACLLVLISSSFWWFGQRTQKVVFNQNPTMGRLLVDQGLLRIHWKKAWDLLKKSQPPDKEMDTLHGLIFSQQHIDFLVERMENQDYDWRAIIPNRQGQSALLSDDNFPRDDFEQRLLDAYDAVDTSNEELIAQETYRDRISADGNKYHYYQPIRLQPRCMQCHTPLPTGADIPPGGTGTGRGFGLSSGDRPGDLMAVVQVTISNVPVQKAMAKNWAFLITAAVITVALAMIAAYAIVRYVIVKPLKYLRDVSDAVSHGNTAIRAEIHTGDEFEDLAVAFNRMLGHLTTTQEELREVNVDLDSKVDELAQANMQLYEMNRIKSDFLATMSHELRTPLNSILGFSDVLGSIDALDDKQQRYVQNIQKSGRVLLEMINDILDLAKIESGRAEVHPVDFPVEQVVVAQCDMARPLAEKKNIDLDAEIQPGLPPLHQDQVRLQQVLNNLLSNAIKFTPEGGRITVVARRDEADMLVLSVTDTGVGIAEEDLVAIFQKFRQGSNALADGDAMTREYSGTGLGLSIVKEICKLLGGEVSAESRLGKGSTFTVRLPWVLEERPRLDSALADEFEQFGRLRPDAYRESSGQTASS
ncbi:MAG: HAMP domain-containing protein [Pirellulales bacterium]|nr:HAMP domain-containing protein [Pirellulales bacterium]